MHSTDVQGSWGFSPHPRAWPKFLKWQARLAPTGYVPSDLKFKGKPVITSKWWEGMERGGRDPKMWTAWCMKYMEER